MNRALDEWIYMHTDLQCPEVASVSGLRCDMPAGHRGMHEATTRWSWSTGEPRPADPEAEVVKVADEPSKVVDLMAALEASLAAVKKNR